MRWTQLLAIAAVDFFPKALKTKVETLNQSIVGLVKERDRHDKRVAKLSDQNADELDFDNLVGLPFDRISRLELLQRELKLRRQIEEVWPELRTAYSAQHDAAFERAQQLEASVRQKLIDLGYHDFQDSVADPAMLQPGWILRHPDVRAARDEADALFNQLSDNARFVQNANAMEQVLEELNQARRRALPV